MPHDEPHDEKLVRPGIHFVDYAGRTWEVEQVLIGSAICHRCDGASETRAWYLVEILIFLEQRNEAKHPEVF